MDIKLRSGLAVCIGLAGYSPIGAQAKPNIIVIMADDMGFSDLGCFGSEIPTPNLDNLAKNGIRFSQFYNTARCCPTRASLLTGLYQHQTGIGMMAEDPSKEPNVKDRNDFGVPGYRGFLNHNCMTIAEVLKPAGYHTYMAGKWHVGMHGEEKWPLQRGFERYYGILAGASSYLKPEGGRGLTFDNKRLPAPEGEYYTTDAFTDYAIRFIKEQKDESPFFLYLAFNAPHWPLQAKKSDYEKFVGKYMRGWDELREERYQRQKAMKLFDRDIPLSPRDPRVRAWSEVDETQKTESDFRMAVYAAQVNCIDQNIGKLVETLISLKRFDNTLIIFLSDNGGCAEPYREFGGGNFADINNPALSGAISYGIAWANMSNTPFFEYKVKSYEGGISAPFIAHWPDKIIKTAGKVFHTPASLIDLMPTLIDAAGAKYPEKHPDGTRLFPLEGFSLLPAFVEGKGKEHQYMFWEHSGFSAIRKGEWKAYKPVDETEWELYDLRTDRDEQIDVSKAHPDLVNELNGKWYEWANSHQVLPKKK
jgi:arylsulfatase